MIRLVSEISEEQLLVMRDALEFYSRFLSGQVDDFPDEIRFKYNKSPEAREAMRRFKAAIFPELHPNQAYGVGRVDKQTESIARRRQISYEIYRQIYVFFTARRAAAGEDVRMDVYSSPTLKYSGEKLLEFAEYADPAESGDPVEIICPFCKKEGAIEFPDGEIFHCEPGCRAYPRLVSKRAGAPQRG